MSSRSSRRRSGRGHSESDALLIKLFDELLVDAFKPSVKQRNQMRMAHCTLIWASSDVVVGLCPAFDDFLIWLNPEQELALKVVITPDVLRYFTENVLPLIIEHHRASDRALFTYHDAERKWALDIAQRVADNEIKLNDVLPESPKLVTITDTSGARTAHETVTTALRAFAERYEATHEV